MHEYVIPWRYLFVGYEASRGYKLFNKCRLKSMVRLVDMLNVNSGVLTTKRGNQAMLKAALITEATLL